MFRGCLPKAAKPTMLSRAPTTGPFRSPPTSRMYVIPTMPDSAMLTNVGLMPATAMKSVCA